MLKASLALAVLSFCCSCLTPTDGDHGTVPVEGTPTDGELIGMARAAERLTIASGGPPARKAASSVEPTPEEAQRWLDDHLPKWQVYLSGPEWGPHCDPGNPLSLDAYCQLRAEDPHGKVIHLSDWRLRDEGSAYLFDLIDEDKLSMLDIVVIQAQIELGLHVGGLAVRVDTSRSARALQKFVDELDPPEEATPGPMPPPPWAVAPDAHTYGPGSGWPTAPPAHEQQVWPATPRGLTTNPFVAPPPVGWKPPRNIDDLWIRRAMGADGRIRSPNGDPGGYSTRDFLNGLDPWENAEVFDTLIPGKATEVFKCQSQVVMGYKQNCSDYQLFTSERWKKAWEELWNVDDLRRSPKCDLYCRDLVWVPTLVGLACGLFTLAPPLTPVTAAGKAACGALGISSAVHAAGATLAGGYFEHIGTTRFCADFCTRHP